jgi:hypothetical protein
MCRLFSPSFRPALLTLCAKPASLRASAAGAEACPRLWPGEPLARLLPPFRPYAPEQRPAAKPPRRNPRSAAGSAGPAAARPPRPHETRYEDSTPRRQGAKPQSRSAEFIPLQCLSMPGVGSSFAGRSEIGSAPRSQRASHGSSLCLCVFASWRSSPSLVTSAATSFPRLTPRQN